MALVEDVLEQLDGFLFLFADEFQLAQLLFGDPKGDLSRNSAVGRRAGTLIPERVKGRLSGPFQSYGHGRCRQLVTPAGCISLKVHPVFG